MAFQANKGDFSRRSAVDHLAVTLHAYIDGREKLYALESAMQEIDALFGASAAIPTRLIRRLIDLHPERYDERFELATNALQLVDRLTRGDFD